MDLIEARNLDRHHQGPVWSSEKKKKRKEEGMRKTVQWVGEKQRRTVRCRGRDRESGQTWVVLLGHSSTHGLSARLKDTLGFKRGAEEEDFFSLLTVYKNISYLFLAVQAALAAQPEQCSMTMTHVTLPSLIHFFFLLFFYLLILTPAPSPPPPPDFLF